MFRKIGRFEKSRVQKIGIPLYFIVSRDLARTDLAESERYRDATHSHPQSCDPFDQRHGSRALAGARITRKSNSCPPELPIFVTDGNRYCLKFLRLRSKLEVRDSRPSRFRTLPELSIRGAGQKDRSSGDENGRHTAVKRATRAQFPP